MVTETITHHDTTKTSIGIKVTRSKECMLEYAPGKQIQTNTSESVPDQLLLCDTHHRGLTKPQRTRPDTAKELAVCSVYRVDQTRDSVKGRGGGLHIYVNNSWRTAVDMAHKH